MNEQRGYISEELQMVLALAVLVAGILIIAAIFERWSCHSKWDRSGMGYDWGPIQGCLIKMPNGAWIPEERYREIDN